MKRSLITKPRSPQSISAALLTYFLIIEFILIALVEIICYYTVQSTFETRIRKGLTAAGEEIATEVRENPPFAVDSMIRSYRRSGINAYIISGDGEILIPFDSDDSEIDDSMPELKKRLGELENGVAVIYKSNKLLNYVSLIDGSENYVFATATLSVVSEGLHSLVLYIVIVGVVVMLITGFVSYIISSRLSSGIRNLSDTATKFAKGDFSVKFDNAEYKELADLSLSLNTVRDEVKKSGDFQRELLANVTHDFKTPLTMIKAYASMIREISGDDPEKRDKHLQVIIDETDRLTCLVNDMLSVSKVNASIDELNLKVFNLTEFLYGIINKFGYLQETQGYNIMVDVEPNLYTRADEEKIGQVIYNLLGNAVNYTGEDKTVYITLKRNFEKNRIYFSVRDTGKGIAPEDLSNIWNRYYSVKENHTRPVKGTGLGLSIVKKILETHKFEFGVESELDKGSTFWVDFIFVPDSE